MTYDCRIYMCILLLVLQNVPSKKPEPRKPFALASTKAFVVLERGVYTQEEEISFILRHFYPRKSSIRYNHHKYVFHLCHCCRRFCFQREQGAILFLSFSLCFPFCVLCFLCARFEGLWWLCFSLSLSRRLIFPRRRTPIPGGKSLDRHRAIFHTPLPLLPSRRVSSRWRQRRVSFPPLVFSLLSK